MKDLAVMRFDETDPYFIQTYTGKKFWPLNPQPEHVCIEDIAHSLSLQCRYTGHSKCFISVAQHSVLVSCWCDPADALWGLLHDAAEAYFADLPPAIKHHPKFSDFYYQIKAPIQRAVLDRYGLPRKKPASVDKADKVALATEARDFMAPLVAGWNLSEAPQKDKVYSWPHPMAEQYFLNRFRGLVTLERTGG